MTTNRSTSAGSEEPPTAIDILDGIGGPQADLASWGLESLAALAVEHRDKAEAQASLTDEVVAAVADRQLLGLLLPSEVGGSAQRISTVVDIVVQLAEVDSSLAWIVGQGATMLAEFHRISRPGELDVLSPLANPSATPAFTRARVEPEGSGYRVSGQWRFASGARFADFFAGAAPVDEGGRTIVRWFVFTPDEVELVPVWDTVGMRATSTESFSVDDRFVPTGRSFVFFGPSARSSYLDAVSGVLSPFTLIAAGCQLGTARRAIRAAVGAGETVRYLAGAAVADHPAHAADLAWQAGAVSAATDQVRRAARAIDDVAASGRRWSDAQRIATRLATLNGARVALDAVMAVSRAVGTASTVNSGELSRCQRDVLTMADHLHIARDGAERVGLALAGRGLDDPRI